MYYKSMKFDLEHDWQGNMSTPRKNLGVKTKLNLFIILAFIWSFVGLIGHEPWAPQESNTISQIVSIVQESDFIVPKAASNDFIQNQPLYSLVAASSIKIFSPFLAHHDAARLTNIIWISLTLLILGMATRELWGLGFGRSAGLIFIASVGLILNVHTLTPEIGAMPGYVLSLYALCLYSWHYH
jgi:4-amino-4-deoxy-L-arabinose transferase-like glycosyltransferase